ncbi:hypothetical protein N780_14750 [Pontibacillus chungwhensis BH030062]|uniref:Uncharacterized protein n=1 Tax=Pontibacillus chungwhensis BH030062 TaxID=1385513 RepID=A0A0A2V1R6_9BACI|nr:hypothetical protein N780_14750 [Pontibacillus chungwhensis BH030062]
MVSIGNKLCVSMQRSSVGALGKYIARGGLWNEETLAGERGRRDPAGWVSDRGMKTKRKFD